MTVFFPRNRHSPIDFRRPSALVGRLRNLLTYEELISRTEPADLLGSWPAQDPPPPAANDVKDLSDSKDGTTESMEAADFRFTGPGARRLPFAINHDGVNEVIGLPSIATMTDVSDKVTMISWFKINVSANYGIFHHGRNNSNGQLYFQCKANGKVAFAAQNNAGAAWEVESVGAFDDDVWYMVAGVNNDVDTRFMRIYGPSGLVEKALNGTFRSGAVTFDRAAIGAFRRDTDSLFLVGQTCGHAMWSTDLTVNMIDGIHSKGIER